MSCLALAFPPKVGPAGQNPPGLEVLIGTGQVMSQPEGIVLGFGDNGLYKAYCLFISVMRFRRWTDHVNFTIHIL